jgi:hypothetical protein
LAEQPRNGIRAEVGTRLDDLFGEKDEPINEFPVEPAYEDSPLRNLKATILSIDWEITDKEMARFIEQVNRLKNEYRDDRILLLFLKLLESIGRYVKTHKVKAHPDAIKLLNSVYNSFERVVAKKGMSLQEKKNLLSSQIAKFNKLRESISLRKSGEVKSKPITEPSKAEAAPGKLDEMPRPVKEKSPIEGDLKDTAKKPDVDYEIAPELLGILRDTIRQCIKAEFEVFKKEIKTLMGNP